MEIISQCKCPPPPHTHTLMYLYTYLFIVDKRKVIKLSAGGAAIRFGGAFVVDVFDKLECLFVSVDECEGIVLWVDSQKLWRKKAMMMTVEATSTHVRLHVTLISTHLLILFISDITCEAAKLWLPAYERELKVQYSHIGVRQFVLLLGVNSPAQPKGKTRSSAYSARAASPSCNRV